MCSQISPFLNTLHRSIWFSGWLVRPTLSGFCTQHVFISLQLLQTREMTLQYSTTFIFIFPVGLQGTTAFCKLAVNLPVSDNDVSGMKILDTRSSNNLFKQNHVATDLPKQRIPPVVVMLDAVVDAKNCALAIQACTNHLFIELKMSNVTMHEVPGGRDIYFLLTTLEVSWSYYSNWMFCWLATPLLCWLDIWYL